MTCITCGRELVIGDWPWCNKGDHGQVKEKVTQWHPSEAVVVHRQLGTGHIRYPGRTDAKLPHGYERVVIRDDRTLARFERENHVMNERRHFDNNGRADG